MTAGSENGIYNNFAKHYAELLFKHSAALDILTCSGSVENCQRLKDPKGLYNVGLVQSGTGNVKEAPGLKTLASVSLEPI